MEEEKGKIAESERQKTAVQKTGNLLKDLLFDTKTKADPLLERLDDEVKLTDIIHEYRVKKARSHEIARAIIKYVKEG